MCFTAFFWAFVVTKRIFSVLSQFLRVCNQQGLVAAFCAAREASASVISAQIPITHYSLNQCIGHWALRIRK